MFCTSQFDILFTNAQKYLGMPTSLVKNYFIPLIQPLFILNLAWWVLLCDINYSFCSILVCCRSQRSRLVSRLRIGTPDTDFKRFILSTEIQPQYTNQITSQLCRGNTNTNTNKNFWGWKGIFVGFYWWIFLVKYDKKRRLM